jgi:sRNA-binding carbon storage regulator CsrA
MLVIGRRKDECVLLRVPGLADHIRIMVVRCCACEECRCRPCKNTAAVRLGIEAPPTVEIMREELL